MEVWHLKNGVLDWVIEQEEKIKEELSSIIPEYSSSEAEYTNFFGKKKIRKIERRNWALLMNADIEFIIHLYVPEYEKEFKEIGEKYNVKRLIVHDFT